MKNHFVHTKDIVSKSNSVQCYVYSFSWSVQFVDNFILSSNNCQPSYRHPIYPNTFLFMAFMCGDRHVICFMSTSGSWRMLRSPALKWDLVGQFRFTQFFSRALLSHLHRKQVHSVHLRLWPRRKYTVLRTKQTINLCLFILQQLNEFFMAPYSSGRQSEFPIGTATYKIAIVEETTL